MSVPPTVEVSPSTQVESVGDSATVQCMASGRPPPRVSWQINEQDLEASHARYLLTGKFSLTLPSSTTTRSLNYVLFRHAAGSSEKYCQEYVCLSVHSHNSETTRPNFTKFLCVCLRPWFGISLAALRYVSSMYFRFYGYDIFPHNAAMVRQIFS